jgi:hypothetical protein
MPYGPPIYAIGKTLKQVKILIKKKTTISSTVTSYLLFGNARLKHETFQ